MGTILGCVTPIRALRNEHSSTFLVSCIGRDSLKPYGTDATFGPFRILAESPFLRSDVPNDLMALELHPMKPLP